MNTRRRTFVTLAIAVIFSLIAGVTPAAAAESGRSFNPPRPWSGDSTCAGIRGNGPNLFAHYGALARHVEEYGTITCAAGGSSGSITAFLMESMWANERMHRCGAKDRWCNAGQQRNRQALMLKSVVGLTDAGLFQDVDTVSAILAGVQEGQILELLEGDAPLEGVAAFGRVLRDLGPLVNPEIFTLLATSPDPVFHVTDIIDGLQKGLQFQVDSDRIFVRTSVINTVELAELFGLYGNFYAGYGPADMDGFEDWLRACAFASKDLTWEQTAALPANDGRTCGEELTELFNAYREARAAVGGPNRLDDPVGRYMSTFGVTGVITGDSRETWAEARDAWLAAEPIPFTPDFDDIGVGYWGKQAELDRIERRLDRRYDDLVAEQFEPLGPANWREVLSSSPAEPGFAPAIPLSSGALSVGGWADPLRIIPLDALGAKTTISINRLGGVGGFTENVTRLLNASEAEIDALYSTTDPASSFFISLDIATGVWCTNWDGQGGDPNRLFNDAYNSPLITDDKRLLNSSVTYPNVGPDFAIPGCVPGLPVG